MDNYSEETREDADSTHTDEVTTEKIPPRIEGSSVLCKDRPTEEGENILSVIGMNVVGMSDEGLKQSNFTAKEGDGNSGEDDLGGVDLCKTILPLISEIEEDIHEPEHADEKITVLANIESGCRIIQVTEVTDKFKPGDEKTEIDDIKKKGQEPICSSSNLLDDTQQNSSQEKETEIDFKCSADGSDQVVQMNLVQIFDKGQKLSDLTDKEVNINGGEDDLGAADLCKTILLRSEKEDEDTSEAEEANEELSKSVWSSIQDGCQTNLLTEVTDKFKPGNEKTEMDKIEKKEVEPKCAWSDVFDETQQDSSQEQEIEVGTECLADSSDQDFDKDSRTQSISEAKKTAEFPSSKVKEDKWKHKTNKEKKAADKGKETDPKTLARRFKEIMYGKHTVGYKRYLALVPKSQRKQEHPITPPVNRKFSRRCWDGLVRSWRLRLHEFDPPKLPTDPSSGDSSCSSSTSEGAVIEEAEDFTNKNVIDNMPE